MRNLKAIVAISIVFTLLVLITAIVTMRTEMFQESTEQPEHAIVHALQTGNVDSISRFFSPNVSLFTSEEGIYNNLTPATQQLRLFFKHHPVKSFKEESVLSGHNHRASYLQGILYTNDQTFSVSATIDHGKIQDLNLY